MRSELALEPCGFPQANTILGPPTGTSEDDCGSLMCWRGQYPDGAPITIARFRVTQQALQQIQATGELWLHVNSVSFPPVALTTENPFNDPTPQD